MSSSGTSTTATWLSLTGAGAGKIDGAVTAMVMTAVATAVTCCGSVAAATLRGGGARCRLRTPCHPQCPQ
jgi:hypothetical protein